MNITALKEKGQDIMENIRQRVEKHILRPCHSHYSLLRGFCHLSKNLYNHANYEVRQAFIKEGRWIRYKKLDQILKADREYPDYAAMPSAQSAQQTLRILDRNWKSFLSGLRDYKENPEKYRGRPRMPGYLEKEGFFQIVLTNQNCRLKDGYLRFPRSFQGFTLKPAFVSRQDLCSFQQVRLIPHRHRIVIELVYNITVKEEQPDRGRYAGIDIGVNNLAVVCNNAGLPAFAVNGRPLKSINQYYNRKVSHYREICKKQNGRDYSRRMDSLTEKRDRKIGDYLHKASRKIVDLCERNGINTIVIGKNDGWKQNSALSKKNNQHFVQIPFAKFIRMIQYKAEEKGIAVILTEESYTSGTSFIDGERPVRADYDRTRRVHRGMFIAGNGMKINADLNGAYQILKKAFPVKWDRGCALHPAVVNVA